MSLADMARGQTATIERKTTTADTLGGQVESWATTYSSVPCSIQPRNAKMGNGGNSGMRSERDRREIEVTHVLYTTTPLSLLTGGRVTAGGHAYHVQSAADTAGKSRLYVVQLLEKS